MDRVWDELYPRLSNLALLASQYGIGFNIDAEEADRLELSLDLLEALAADPALGSWQGLGFVVQAYQKRAPSVVDYLISLAESAKRRLMIRLVKGAYWDSEIKRAQVDGLERLSGLHAQSLYGCVLSRLRQAAACAARSRLPAVCDAQRAYARRPIYHMAGPDFQAGDYEFQCLHGMGETLYGHVVGAGESRPALPHLCAGRTHETLLAYLVRAAAGEWRQHLLRPSARRRENAHRGAHRRSGRWRRPDMAARRIQLSCCRKICSAQSARIRRGSIFPMRRCARSLSAPSRTAGRRIWKPGPSSHAPLLPGRGRKAGRQSSKPCRHCGLCLGCQRAWHRGRNGRRRCICAEMGADCRRGARRNPGTGGGPAGAFHGAALRADRARGGQDHAQRHFGGARGRRLLPLLRGAGPRA